MIASVGDVSIDHYITTGEKYVGGIATNFAVHVHRLNEPVTLIAAIGDDENGEFFKRRMKEEGLNIENISVLPGATSKQRIRLMGKEREFCGFFSGVLLNYKLQEKEFAAIRNSAAVVTPLTDGLKHVFEQVMKTDCGTTIKAADFSRDADIPGFSHGDIMSMLLHYTQYLDIAFLGGDESMVETTISIAEANPDKIIILTLGPKGSIAFHQGKTFKKPAIWIKNMIDTTGCGDAFRAGFIVTYLKNKNIQDALDFGSKIAAKTATHIGAF